MGICPLFFTSAADLENFDCRPDRCAWSDGEACAIVRIAESLDALATNGVIKQLDLAFPVGWPFGYTSCLVTFADIFRQKMKRDYFDSTTYAIGMADCDTGFEAL